MLRLATKHDDPEKSLVAVFRLERDLKGIKKDKEEP